MNKEKEYIINSLKGYIVKSGNNLQESNYSIKPNEEYEIIKSEHKKPIELRDRYSNIISIDVEYLINNFEFLFKLD